MLKPTKRKVILSLIGIFLLLLASQGKNQDITPTKSPILPESINEKQVLSYFYFWYDLPNGVHSTALGNHPADNNASYKNPDWFKTQLADMEESEIDTLLAAYWSKLEPSSETGLTNLIFARNQLLSEGKHPPAISLFLDTGLFDLLSWREKDFTNKEGKQKFYGFIKEFYEQVPKEHWGYIDSKPIVWLWRTWAGIRFNQDTLNYIYEEFEKDFGIRPYIVREKSWNYPVTKSFWGKLEKDFANPIITDDIYAWGATLDGYQDIGSNVASIGPGYDERHLVNRESGLFQEREDGKWYKDNFEKAIQSRKPLIVIETWNEFHEASDIADSKEHGREYIDLTRRYANRFKSHVIQKP